MLPIPNSGLLGLYWLIALPASLCSAIFLCACVAGIRRRVSVRTVRDVAITVLVAAVVGFWDYLVINGHIEYNRRQDNIELAVSLLEHPSTPPTAVTAAAESPEKAVRAAVATHPAASPEVLVVLARDPSKSVRVAVAEHPGAPLDALEILGGGGGGGGGDSDASIREIIAARADTPLEILSQLAIDDNEAVAAAALAHPEVPPRALAAALQRSLQNIDTAQDAADDGGVGLRVGAAAHPSAGVVTLRLLASDPAPAVRAAVAARLDAPADVLAVLAADPDPDARAVAAANTSTAGIEDPAR